MNSKFPKNFFWGAATSAHQIEGGLENNWSIWEREHSKTASEKIKKNRPWFLKNKENYTQACDPENYISGNGCDSFNKYKEDVKALKEMGLNSYRFSVDWSRIEPKKGEFSDEGIQYYKDLIKELRENNIEPFLTCWHWPIPLWLDQENGLFSKNIVRYFERYVKFLVENLGKDVNFWITINEPLIIAVSYLFGHWPPQKKNVFQFYKVCFVNLVEMHKAGYRIIKEYNSDLQVSIAKNNSANQPYDNKIWNRVVCTFTNYVMNILFLDRIKEYLDYIGLNFYFKNRISISGRKNDNDRISDMGWWMRPDAIYDVLKELKDRYDLPIYITENGVADREDKYRKWWLDETVLAMEKALDYGVDLRGYMHWSLLDNFEWAEGYWPQFGLVSVDRYTFERKIKKSGWYYRDIVEKQII